MGISRPVRRPGDVAFRLVNELEGLIDGIRADGVINPLEVERVERWLMDNDNFSSVHPFSEVAQCLRSALADGHLSADECEDLYFVAQRLTRGNPYFDQIRTGVQVLTGTMSGIAADRTINAAELDHMQRWIDDWGHLKGMWPFDECEAVVTAILIGKHITEDARSAMLSLAESFPIAGAASNSGPVPLLARGACAVNPHVEFESHSFVFTGESSKGDRGVLVDHAAAHGAIIHNNVRQDTDYLVVCDASSPYWAFSCYGRKVEKAMQNRKAGYPIVIVHEADFWDATVE
jgi:hypothetical protein